MNRQIVLVFALCGLALSSRPAATPGVGGSAEVTRNVYISATESSGAPVIDLAASEITVKEGGKERQVTSLAPATAPMEIAIVVDDAGIGAFQTALSQFFQQTVSRAQFSVTQLNPQATKVVDFTNDVAALKGALGRIGSRGRSQTDGDQMLDAILQAAKALERRKPQRPIILALTVAGGSAQSIEPTDVLSALRSSGAALNVVFVTGSDLGMVLGDGPKQSGGRIEQAGTAPAITTAILKIAQALQHQYLLTYTLPDGVKMSDRLAVSTSRKGITLTSPSRIADK